MLFGLVLAEKPECMVVVLVRHARNGLLSIRDSGSWCTVLDRPLV